MKKMMPPAAAAMFALTKRSKLELNQTTSILPLLDLPPSGEDEKLCCAFISEGLGENLPSPAYCLIFTLGGRLQIAPRYQVIFRVSQLIKLFNGAHHSVQDLAYLENRVERKKASMMVDTV